MWERGWSWEARAADSGEIGNVLAMAPGIRSRGHCQLIVIDSLSYGTTSAGTPPAQGASADSQRFRLYTANEAPVPVE